MAIMGFLPTSQGKIEVRGSVAYVPQEAWLINDTLEENILMGKVKDDERYTRVIKACQLEEVSFKYLFLLHTLKTHVLYTQNLFIISSKHLF